MCKVPANVVYLLYHPSIESYLRDTVLGTMLHVVIKTLGLSSDFDGKIEVCFTWLRTFQFLINYTFDKQGLAEIKQTLN